MSFGLRNAAQTFQLFIDDALKNLDFCFAYLDVILVFSQSVHDHEHLRTLFTRLQTYGILLNHSKCLSSPRNFLSEVQNFPTGLSTTSRMCLRSTGMYTTQNHSPIETFPRNAKFLSAFHIKCSFHSAPLT